MPKNESKDALRLTPPERRQMLIEERRIAVESARDLLKWTIAALLTLNSGAALATFTRDGFPRILGTPLAGVFVGGAAMAVAAGIFAALAAFIAVEVAQDKLGLEPSSEFKKRIYPLLFWVTGLGVPLCVGVSFYALMQGLELHARAATLNETDMQRLRDGMKPAADKTAQHTRAKEVRP